MEQILLLLFAVHFNEHSGRFFSCGTEYADDIYPYATFEVNEPQRDSRALSGVVPTLDRKHPARRASGGGQVRVVYC